ncbi:hypothetical protein [Candidatus Enterococcus ikei]|uniref:Lipoprotein n=1 Tax=Candidatus Enterococcus ikei TaxID=2815326 RepID=A0ABS3H3N5_9ENTE|nr:hypothetical protein [Enterococcus sp. DIV0869a]MBO0441650.1 hypothetical protein [Enterococcus sp. DIV0869a]
MKKIALGLLVLSLSLVFAGCGSSKEKSVNSSSTEQTTENTSVKKDKKMKEIQEDLEEKAVEINQYSEILSFTREKGIDYDYFELDFVISNKTNEVLESSLVLKGNVDGEKKETLHYDVSKGRLVESSYSNTDINALAEVLKSLDYSDKEILDFAQWYYQKNK